MHPRLTAIALIAALLGGCTYYQVAPGTYATTPATSFDRSWEAVRGALADQGVALAREDRGAGVMSGVRNSITITANVRTQADGSVRVEFSTSGATASDPDFINRVTNAYNRRMGR